MIRKLSVSNYALIDSAEISFTSGMTIITGETGAGKSILLGALSLLTGVRADASVLTDRTRKCIVEGEFDIRDLSLESFFKTHDLDIQDSTTIRREITPEGKSRAFVNDTPVTLNLLRELGARLVDIHSQHETLTIRNSDFQAAVTDSCAGNGTLLEKYSGLYRTYTDRLDKLNRLKEQTSQEKAGEDYSRFLLREITDAKLVPGEQDTLENELHLLNHAGEIKSVLNKALQTLEGDDGNPVTVIGSVATGIRNISKYLPEATALAERFASVHIELKDLAGELEALERKAVFDPGRVENVSARLDTIYRLQQKHRVATVEELIETGNRLTEKLSNVESLESGLSALEQELASLKSALEKTAAELHERRLKAIPEMESQIKGMLRDVGMKHAVLKAELKPLPAGVFRANGNDEINFLFSANKGMEYRELQKVASGGELSRLMLCIKSMLARKSGLPTILFDEIDSGISGEIAVRVAGIIRDMANERQVMVITHLPQMAARGNDHWYVYKETGKRAVTRIRKLNREERISEIAKMLSGDAPTAAALTNARELMGV